MNTKPELAVALDLPSRGEIQNLVRQLPPEVKWYKVGLELFTALGPPVVEYLKNNGSSVFLDLKLHDIPRTVERAVTAAAHHGVDLLTIHASGGPDMLATAASAAAKSQHNPKLVAVTALTSLDDSDLRILGLNSSVAEYATSLAETALAAGIDGLVCSVLEAKAFRQKFGDKPILVTPGIRPNGTDAGDQKRIATPADAVEAGASILVVGRAIVQAPDPAKAAATILEEMYASV